MPEHDVDALELAAFRFVAGEMLPDEAAGFEKQLASDQPARDAVCRAVALTEKLVLAETRHIGDEKLASVSKSRKPAAFARVARPLSWMAIGAIAASLTFMVARRVPSEFGNQPPEPPVVDNSLQSQLPSAAFDANQIDTLAWLEMSDVPRWDSELVWPDEQPATPEILSALSTPTTIPDWILQTNGDIEWNGL